jgi:hypothetical protein
MGGTLKGLQRKASAKGESQRQQQNAQGVSE